MQPVAIGLSQDGRTAECTPADSGVATSCPFLTYLAVVVGFAASFALLGVLI